MKNLILYLKLGILLLSINNSNAQSQFKVAGTTNQTTALFCSHAEYIEFDIIAGQQINDNNGQKTINVEIHKFIDPNNSTRVANFLWGGVGIGDFPSSMDGNFKIRFNSLNIDFWTINEKVSVNNIRSSGIYFAKIIIKNNTNPNLNFTINTPSITAQVGLFPQFTLNNGSLITPSQGIDNAVTLLSGCNGGDVLLRLKSDQTCAIDAFRVIIVEKDIDGNFIGQTYNRPLSNSEVNSIVGPNAPGLSIKTLNTNVTNGSNNGSITLTPGKWYNIWLVYCPQNVYLSTGVSLQYKSGNWDLAIKDNTWNPQFDKLGYEPGYIWRNDLFRSPDLINKLSNTSFPNTTLHENPDYITNAGNTNKIITTISNIGCVASPANVPLRLFWTRARTEELYNKHWVFGTNNVLPKANSNPVIYVPGGSEITISNPTMNNPYNANSSPFLIPSIAPLSQYKIPFANGVNWFPPNPVDYDVNNGSMGNGGAHPVICLLARINEKNSTNDPIIWEPTGLDDRINPYVRNNNNVATRNSWLVNEPNFLIKPNGNTGGVFNYGFATVLVNNPSLAPKTVSICVDLMPDVAVSNTFNDFGSINIGVTNGLYNQWMLGGQASENLAITSPTLFTMTNGSRACLNNITLPGGFNEQIGLRFNFNSSALPATPVNLNYQLSEYSVVEGDSLFGSHTVFVVDVPSTEPSFINGTNDNQLKNNDLNFNQDQIIIYPNPSSDNVSISFNNYKNEEFLLEIFDSKGTKVFSTTYNKNGISIEQISTKDFSNGIYNIVDKSSNKTFVEKLIIIH